jgi:hypothetical protein
MALVVADSIWVNASTSGLTDFTIGAAIAGYRTFSDAAIPNGSTIHYSARTATQFENGEGIYNAGVLSRVTIFASSSANAKVNFSGNPSIAVTPLAEDFAAHEGRLNTLASLVVQNLCGRNGGLEIWQRGTSIAVAASTVAYTADGWYLATGANQASVVSRQTGLSYPQSLCCARVQRNSGQTGVGVMRFAFPLDSDEWQASQNKNVVLSFIVRAGANWSPASGTVSYALYTGQGGTGPAKRNATPYTSETAPITGSVNLTPGGAVVTVLSGVAALVVCSQLELQFFWTPVGTAGANDWFEIDDVDLRVVAVNHTPEATFERTNFVQDYVRCLRHYETTYDYGVVPGSPGQTPIQFPTYSTSIANGAPFFVWNYKLHKRVGPTGTVYSYFGTAGRVSNGFSADFAAGSGNFIGVTVYGSIVNSSGAALTAVPMVTGNIVADASI